MSATPVRVALVTTVQLAVLSVFIQVSFAADEGHAVVKEMPIRRGMSEAAIECIACHQRVQPGIIQDWKDSRHGHVGVSCLDCHRVSKRSPTATQHEDLVGTDVYVSALVPPSTCGRCHAVELEEFNASGHFRAYHQIIPKDNLHALVKVHEGRGIPDLDTAPWETGCMQCHGTKIELDRNGRPTPETWPNAGMGNIYPNGSTGSCTVCHTRHRFSIAESRRPEACASCHLGPDHPDIEIF